MRTSALLLLSVMLSATCIAADEPTVPNNVQAPVASAESSPSTTTLGEARLRFLPRTEAVCLKLRTYVVQRVDPRSDVTRLRSYSTCQPAWKFETRNAVQHETHPDDLSWSY